MIRPICLFVSLLFVFPRSIEAQTTAQTSFGKNRVQYHRHFDDWMLYETEHLITYWYGDARNVAQAALQNAEYDFAEIQQLLEHQMTDKIEMLVFIDLSDLKQSNIGEEDILQLRAGETKVVGNKIFVYFDGDHRRLRAQVREGLGGVILNSMLFGANLQEIVQNAVLLNLPGWYTNGLPAYCGEEWSPELDDELRDLILSDRYKNFDKLAKEHPRMAGHAFWHYIALHFGKGTVSNLLYLTRINRSIDVGFLYVLGSGYKRTTEAMLGYYRLRYREEAQYTRLPEEQLPVKIRNKKKLPLYHFKLSPDGRRIAYVSNDIGRWKVWVQDLETGHRRCVLKGGARNALQATDLNYPLPAWHPDNKNLAVLFERRDVLYLEIFNPQTKKGEREELAPEYQRVYSLDFINGGELVFSAAVKGYSDLFIYRIRTRQSERITQDHWDDLDASVTFLDGSKGILFASNRLRDTLQPERLDTVLPIGAFDVFFYNLDTRSETLTRLTGTPHFNERRPVGLDSTFFAFLNEENGIYNRSAGYLEPYTAYYRTVFFMRDGAEVSALNTRLQGEWPLEKALRFLAPEDSVRVNLDTTRIDSIRVFPVLQKRPVTYNQTNFSRNIADHHVSQQSGRMVEAFTINGKKQLYLRRLDTSLKSPAWITRYRELFLLATGLPVPKQQIDKPAFQDEAHKRDSLPESNIAADSITPVQPGWLFQAPEHLLIAPPLPAEPEFAREQPTEPREEQAVSTVPVEPLRPVRPRGPFQFGQPGNIILFLPSQIIPYRLRFRTDYISTTIDNNLLFEGLDSYAGSPNGFRTPPPGVLLRANFKDLLEDYVIEAGFRLPTTFNGAEYYLWMDNKKHRIDKRVALYRKSILNTVDESRPGAPLEPFQVRTNSILGQYELRYPFSTFTSLRATFTLRQDKAVTLSTSRPTLEAPDFAEQRAALRLSAVFDNTVDVEMNLRTGTRAKVFVEAVKKFEFNTEPRWSLKLNSGFMTVIGLDARHYQPLDRRSILAVRLAGATTFGSERILYFLGGVDNWIFPQFNNNIPVPPAANGEFGFQTLAANLRGFKQNIRNGNSYALINAELRIPLLKYLSNKPVMSNFWRNFQVVGFFDAGTAWQGVSPYIGDNPLNTIYVYNPPTVAVKVNYFRDPLVAGYGVGVRSLVFGMHVRLDYGWGIETRVVQKPVLHIALGTDF
jgi:hypothetical protein